MTTHISFDVRQDDIFDEWKYPEIRRELEELSRAVFLLPGNHKADIVISYLKNHCIKTEYLSSNRRVVGKITSGNATYTEALFDCCPDNPLFLGDFEIY